MTPAPDPLYETMLRVGVSLTPAEFIAAVAETFRSAEPVSDATLQARFRKTRAYRDFRALLRKAAPREKARILAIGCGPGLACRTAGYAADVTREVHALAVIDQANYACGLRDIPNPPYEMVVTHSLLHFVFDLPPLCEFIRRAVAPGGWYVMANEPNARFWANADCVHELDRVSAAESRRRQVLKYAEPSRYLSKLLRTLRPAEGRSMVEEMNRRLRERLGMRGDLTEKEIVRIVDPHLPDRLPGQYRVGSNGLDWEQLQAGPLSGMKVEAVRTSGYVMRDNPARLPERWRELDRDLADRYPLDGCSFSALWRKSED